jgi:glycosyltransferase involved in cell wall biosynthesis
LLNILPSIVREFPEVLLTVVGEGTPAFEQRLLKDISARSLEKSVLLTGRLEGSLKWAAYASAELFLLPSRQENFAITVAEAMQMGVPVIITNRVNSWPYVEEANAGIVLEETEIERRLKDAVLRSLATPERLRSMGSSGRRFARQKLIWSNTASTLIDCYHRVVEEYGERELGESTRFSKQV